MISARSSSVSICLAAKRVRDNSSDHNPNNICSLVSANSKSNTPTTATSTPENDQNIDNPTTSSAFNDIILISETADNSSADIHNNVAYSGDTFNDDLGDLVSGPNRPIQKEYPKSKFGSQNRAFSSSYYANFEWLEYSIKKNAVFCYACRMFANNFGYTEDTFIKTGFNNWKKISSKLASHAGTKIHVQSTVRLSEYVFSKKSGSVLSKMCTANKVLIEKNRKYVSQLIDIVLYLSKQGIAFRGHEESFKSTNKGNFKEMCELFAKHLPSFNEIHERKINLTSWQIQEDIIDICANLVNKEIFKQITETGFFAIMCDEARCFKEEQLSICVRYSVKFQVFERFLGFVNVSTGQDASHIVSAIFYFFEKHKVDMNAVKIIAQSYDGASVMSGHLNGVQSKIKDFYPCAIYTHCMAHQLNLIVVDTCKNIKVSL
ncbi:zinc finger MYM-type protein 1-like [Metopolophium dirhodum]|uniref:zinc finger MYM-type protein 1-like n=1 Tax=Metopolophium dirhodum TaxID=44670 RepID=UPI00298FB0E8|nr:zinc finger MYM-type protein 1-like [Metopolophium dirhodum]